MIYLLYSQKELNTFRIWQGHLKVVEEALLGNGTEYEIIHCDKPVEKKFGKCDLVINFGNHQYLGSKILNSLAESLKNVGSTIFFMDDYQAPPATQMRKAVLKANNILITNICEPITRESLAHFEKAYVNLNKASFVRHELNKNPKYPTGFIYWGSYRKGRDEKYSAYLAPELYKTFISSSDRGHDKFFNAFHNYTPREKLNIPIDLQDYGFTVYMRDAKQPAQSPANRFYEAVGAGLPIFFDKDCIPHIDVPEHIHNYIVTHAEDIPLGRLEDIQTEQRVIWGQRNYRAELIEEIMNVFSNYGIM